VYKNLARIRIWGVKGQAHQGQKNETVWHFFRPVRRFSEARLRLWEIQRMLSSCTLTTSALPFEAYTAAGDFLHQSNVLCSAPLAEMPVSLNVRSHRCHTATRTSTAFSMH